MNDLFQPCPEYFLQRDLPGPGQRQCLLRQGHHPFAYADRLQLVIARTRGDRRTERRTQFQQFIHCNPPAIAGAVAFRAPCTAKEWFLRRYVQPLTQIRIDHFGAFAMRAVSPSRISPINTISGSCRRMFRSAFEKL